jgi:hypothetical protein
VTLWGSDPAVCRCLGSGGGAFSTALKMLGSSQLAAAAAAASATSCSAAAAVLLEEFLSVALAPLRRSLVGLTAGTGPVVAEVAAAVG